eukprot:856172-Pelagomonas_calceolata.AAC.3
MEVTISVLSNVKFKEGSTAQNHLFTILGAKLSHASHEELLRPQNTGSRSSAQGCSIDERIQQASGVLVQQMKHRLRRHRAACRCQPICRHRPDLALYKGAHGI